MFEQQLHEFRTGYRISTTICDIAINPDRSTSVDRHFAQRRADAFNEAYSTPPWEAFGWLAGMLRYCVTNPVEVVRIYRSGR